MELMVDAKGGISDWVITKSKLGGWLVRLGWVRREGSEVRVVVERGRSGAREDLRGRRGRGEQGVGECDYRASPPAGGVAAGKSLITSPAAR